MLRNADDKKVSQALDHETRLFLALSVCVIQALNQKFNAMEAVNEACKIFFVVFPEQEDAKAKKRP